MPYIYNDEDNAPMNEDTFDQGGHNPTVYLSAYEARMYDKYGEPEPKEKPADGCWNCMNYDPSRGACTIRWNNLDDIYYNPDLDDREPEDYCDDHDTDPDADPEEWDFGGNEP